MNITLEEYFDEKCPICNADNWDYKICSVCGSITKRCRIIVPPGASNLVGVLASARWKLSGGIVRIYTKKYGLCRIESADPIVGTKLCLHSRFFYPLEGERRKICCFCEKEIKIPPVALIKPVQQRLPKLGKYYVK